MKAKNVLLIENAELDAILIKESLQQNGKQCNINLLQRRGQVVAYFDNLLTLKINEIPDLIIANEELIINKGMNILTKLGDLNNFYIPVIILNSSGCNLPPRYNKNTCCFINKPLDVKEFLAIIKEIKLYWLSLVD